MLPLAVKKSAVGIGLRLGMAPSAYTVFLQSAGRTEEEQLAVEAEFFKRVPLENGLFKTTGAHRLDDINRLLQERIAARWGGRRLRLLDVGVSSGVTTVEWAESLRSEGLDFNIVGTDLVLDATLQSFGSHFHVLHCSTETPLQFDLAGFAVNNYIGRAMKQRVRRLGPVLGCRFAFWVLRSLHKWKLAPRVVSQPLRLLSNQANTDPNIEFVEEDLLGDPRAKGLFHVIRAANVLNPRFFSNHNLSLILQRLCQRLEKNGLLVVVRTAQDRSNNGGVYEADEHGGFRQAASIGSGAEIHDQIMSWASVLKSQRT